MFGQKNIIRHSRILAFDWYTNGEHISCTTYSIFERCQLLLRPS